MTNADQTLCRVIAEKEGATRFHNYPGEDGALWAYFPCGEEEERPKLVPNYLTDPAETVRIEKKLLCHGWKSFYSQSVQVFGWEKPDKTIVNRIYECATAEAYLAMKEGP